MNINNFKSRLEGGGARPNLFRALVTFPGQVGDIGELSNLGSFMIKGASLPASIVAPVEIPYLGRKLKVAGDRTYEPYTLTIINDTNFKVRHAFEKWMDLINDNVANVSTFSQANTALDYMSTVQVQQLGRENDANATDPLFLAEYTLVDAFPTNISAIDLNWESNDAIEEFTVEMNYQYWTGDSVNGG